MRPPRLRLAGAAALACLLAACAAPSAPPSRPDVALPAAWQGPQADTGTAVRPDWWTGFGSPELDRLMAAALAGNRDLQAAASRIEQARAVVRTTGANRLPQLTGSFETTRIGGSGSSPSTRHTAALDASIDPDLFGRNRAAEAAASRRVTSSVYARDDLALLLQAEVASTYFRVLSAGDRLAVARRSLEVVESTQRLLQAQRDAGAISRLEFVRQQGLVSTVRASVPPLELQRQQALDALAVLLGVPVQSLSVSGSSLEALRLPQIAAGLPGELLVHRPDVRRAEADLAAAHADVAAARAALLPSIRLSASGGFEAGTIAALAGSGAGFHALAASLVAPLFDGGRLRGQVQLSEARREELVHAYAQTLLNGLREVEDNLVALQKLAEQSVYQREVLEQAGVALELADLRYRNGAVDFATVLDAQRVQLDALAAQQATTLARYAATVELFRALGGGWTASPEAGA